MGRGFPNDSGSRDYPVSVAFRDRKHPDIIIGFCQYPVVVAITVVARQHFRHIWCISTYIQQTDFWSVACSLSHTALYSSSYLLGYCTIYYYLLLSTCPLQNIIRKSQKQGVSQMYRSTYVHNNLRHHIHVGRAHWQFLGSISAEPLRDQTHCFSSGSSNNTGYTGVMTTCPKIYWLLPYI